MKSTAKMLGVLLVVLLLGPAVIFPLIADLIKVSWVSIPWWGQLTLVMAVALIGLAIVRVIWWVLSGRSTFRHR